MQILVIAATEAEIEPYLRSTPLADTLITGIGVPATIYHLSHRIHQMDYDLVIQAGVAGSFEHSINPGDVVAVYQDCFADLGIMEQDRFSTIYDFGMEDGNKFPFSGGWLKNAGEWLDKSDLIRVKGITVNTVTDNSEYIKKLVNAFSPQVESMEGAGFHYVCLQEDIPFLQIRAVSNYVGERNKANWKLNDAIRNLNATLAELTNRLIPS
jgi:futalosine hydrolase